ncbi:MAG: hypothetical protein SPF70_00775, partial [Lachnospiraceae bacterium]|nr:hypothetical protein [Lachnospiraceae bacterium]
VRGMLEAIADGLDLPEERLKRLIDQELTDILNRKRQEKEAAERMKKEKESVSNKEEKDM